MIHINGNTITLISSGYRWESKLLSHRILQHNDADNK